MKSLIEKIDELMRDYRNHPQEIIFQDLRELRRLVWAEQERMIKELEAKEKHAWEKMREFERMKLANTQCLWLGNSEAYIDALKLIKGE